MARFNSSTTHWNNPLWLVSVKMGLMGDEWLAHLIILFLIIETNLIIRNYPPDYLNLTQKCNA